MHQEHDIRGQPPRLPDVMGRHQDSCATGLRRLQDRLNLADGTPIEVGAGFVQKDDVGLPDQCTGQRQFLLFPARKLRCLLIKCRPQPDPFGPIGGQRMGVAFGHPMQDQRIGQIIAH